MSLITKLFTTEEDLKNINYSDVVANPRLRDFCEEISTPADIDHLLKLSGALWRHSGNPKDPHAEMTGGLCSDGVVDVLRALSYSVVCEIFAHDIAVLFWAINPLACSGRIDWVVGSDHAGAVISSAVARYFNARHDFPDKGPGGSQLWQRLQIGKEETVLQVEDLITTSGSALAVRKGIKEAHSYPIRFIPIIFCVVNRGDISEIDGSIVHLIKYEIKTWSSEECPLCKAGSKKIVQPKKHWTELTGQI